jgi:hypothetical protein
MPLANNTDNILYGKGRLYFKPTGESYIDCGEVPNFEMNFDLTKVDYYSNRAGTRNKVLSFISEKKVVANFNFEEFAPELLNLGLLGDGVVSGSQAAAVIDAVETTTAEDQFVDLGKHDLSYLKVSHGAVTSGPFDAGETVTGGTSSATGKVAWMATGHLELVDITGTFQVGETLTGGTSGATATSTVVETITDDIVVTDAATATARYVKGTDYSVDNFGGLLRELSGGSIAANTCYVSANCSARTTKAVRMLASSAITGELLFIGEPDQGPKYRIQAWTVSLSISGAVGFISDDPAQMPIEAEILADTSGHASEPYARITETA